MINNHPLVKFKDFRNLFIARVISAIGDKFFQISVIWWALNDTEKGKLNVGLIMAATFLPIVLFGPFMGALADRNNKKTTMLFSDFIRGALVFSLFAIFYFEALNFPVILILMFFISAFGPLFESSVASSLITLTDKDSLSQATAVDSSSIQISSVVGAAAGAIAISSIGTGGAFLFNCATYMLSFLFVLLIKTNLSPLKNETATAYISEIKEGFIYLKNQKNIFYLVLFFAVLNFFISPIFILIPMIVKYVIKESVSWLAIFETFFALGLTAVSILLGFKKEHKNPFLSLSFSVLFSGIFFISLAFIPNKYFSVLLLFLMGAAISAGNVIILAFFQNNVPDNTKGRFFALITTISYAVMPLSFMLNGIFAEKTSVETAITVNAAAAIAISFTPMLIKRTAKTNV